jgi:DeoR family transcriptional regulator, suf operon transcriptional repressor
MANTRDFVLKTLLERPEISIKELAVAVDITPISVRHHIQKLHESGLIKMKDVKQGVGRPKRVYSLTDKGMSQFPDGYISLSARLMNTLKSQMTREQLMGVFEDMAKDLLKEKMVGVNIELLSLEERVHWLTEILSEEGFGLDVIKEDNGYKITPLSCPYISLIEDHSEICNFEYTLIQTLLSDKAEKFCSRANGDDVCSYKISANISNLVMDEV